MAYKNLVVEALTAHADHLLKGLKTRQDFVQLFPNEPDLHALLLLAERLKAILKPVEPTAEFKAQLHRDLLAAAHLKQATTTEEKTHMQILLSPKVSIPVTVVITVVIGLLLRRGRQSDVDIVQPASQ